MSRVVQRATFQIHLWLGLALGLYIAGVSATGAVLVFRSELQRATTPALFRQAHPDAPQADVATVVEGLRAAYPDYTLVGVDAPWAGRQNFLAYETKGRAFITVLADASTGVVLGQLPERSFVARVQDLHESLLGGAIGRTLNGVGGLVLVVLSLSGAIIWWPGKTNWRRTSWQLHRTAGIWMLLLIVMWSASGAAFEFSKPFRNAVNRLSPLTVTPRVLSNPARQGLAPSPTAVSFIARARQASPTAEFVRIVMPASDRAPFLVVMTRAGETRTLDGGNVDYFFDQYTGEPLLTFDHAPRTAGDRVVASLVPLHMGAFGGLGVKLVWAVFGLSPLLLFITGTLMWWQRMRAKRAKTV